MEKAFKLMTQKHKSGSGDDVSPNMNFFVFILCKLYRKSATNYTENVLCVHLIIPNFAVLQSTTWDDFLCM